MGLCMRAPVYMNNSGHSIKEHAHISVCVGDARWGYEALQVPICRILVIEMTQRILVSFLFY